jgi:hypothetical protein
MRRPGLLNLPLTSSSFKPPLILPRIRGAAKTSQQATPDPSSPRADAAPTTSAPPSPHTTGPLALNPMGATLAPLLPATCPAQPPFAVPHGTPPGSSPPERHMSICHHPLWNRLHVIPQFRHHLVSHQAQSPLPAQASADMAVPCPAPRCSGLCPFISM